MSENLKASKFKQDSLPVLWARSFFDIQNMWHVNLEKMIPAYLPFKQREDEYFHEMHDECQRFWLGILNQWSSPAPLKMWEVSPMKFDSDVLHNAIANQAKIKKGRVSA
jgi:hypothetical protein